MLARRAVVQPSLLTQAGKRAGDDASLRAMRAAREETRMTDFASTPASLLEPVTCGAGVAVPSDSGGAVVGRYPRAERSPRAAATTRRGARAGLSGQPAERRWLCRIYRERRRQARRAERGRRQMPALHAGMEAAEKASPFMPLRGILGSDQAGSHARNLRAESGLHQRSRHRATLRPASPCSISRMVASRCARRCRVIRSRKCSARPASDATCPLPVRNDAAADGGRTCGPARPGTRSVGGDPSEVRGQGPRLPETANRRHAKDLYPPGGRRVERRRSGDCST
jgi:hypothetical protein